MDMPISNQGTSIHNSQQSGEIKHQIAARGDSVLSGGISVLYMFMNLLSEMADAKYSEMKDKADVARESQSKSNEVDAAIADCAKDGPDATATLSPDVIDYMKKNDIKIEGKTIDEFMTANNSDGDGKLDQGELKEVQSALSTESSKATDFVSQSQLQLQKIMQTYNVTVSLLNSMQTMLAEMNKSIAQNIR